MVHQEKRIYQVCGFVCLKCVWAIALGVVRAVCVLFSLLSNSRHTCEMSLAVGTVVNLFVFIFHPGRK